MKKIITGLFVLFGAVALIGCIGGNTAQERNEELRSINNVYAVSAVTGVDVAMSTSANALIADGDLPETLTVELTDLNIMFGFLRDDLFEVNELVSDLEDYDTLLEISVNGETYLYYFSETLVDSNDLDDEDDDEDDLYNDDEIEDEFVIKGLIVYGDLEFDVTGLKEIEIEDGEEEFETELKIAIDEENYTVIKYERKTEENSESEKEFKLETFKDGDSFRKMKIEFKVDEGQLKVELKISEAHIDIKYELEHDEDDDKAYLEYDIEENGNTFEGTIEISVIIEEDGTVRYVYEQ